MSARIEVTGVDRYELAVERAVAEYRVKLEEHTAGRARRLAELVALLAPRMKKQIDPRFFVGETAASVDHSRIGPTSWQVAVWARWASFLEYGTSKMLAQPYFRPAIKIIEHEE